MSIQELNIALTNAMKNYIKSSSYTDTGALYNSIKFNCVDNNGLKIKFKAMDYIYYLDNGKFVNSFFELETTISMITEYLSKTIELGIE